MRLFLPFMASLHIVELLSPSMRNLDLNMLASQKPLFALEISRHEVI
jgi:hypothetical protein